MMKKIPPFAHRLFLDLNPLRSTCVRCVKKATNVLLAEFDLKNL